MVADATGPQGSPVLALDIGTTELAAAEVTVEGRVLRRVRTPTPRTDDPDALFGSVTDLLDRLGPFDPYHALGVACVGPIDRGSGRVSPVAIHAWRRYPLVDRLIGYTGLTVALDNDARAFALAEGWRGAAVGVDSYLAMVVSDGVCGGIVLNGRLLEGATGNAGHIGHVFVCEASTVAPPDHVPGLLESEASDPAITVRTGVPAADARTSDIRRTGVLVGRAVASVANLLDLRLAVVAGYVALGYGEPFFSSAQAEIDRICTLEHSRGTRILPAGLDSDGPLIGAAAVALRHLGTLGRTF